MSKAVVNRVTDRLLGRVRKVVKSENKMAGDFVYRDVYYCKGFGGHGWFVKSSGYQNFPKGLNAKTARDLMNQIDEALERGLRTL